MDHGRQLGKTHLTEFGITGCVSARKRSKEDGQGPKGSRTFQRRDFERARSAPFVPSALPQQRQR